MKLQISSLKFDADEKLLSFIQKKADKLDLFFDRIIDGEVNLRIQPGDNKKNKQVEMKINVPGNTLFASEQDHNFEKATDEAVESLRRQLKKYKEKVVLHK